MNTDGVKSHSSDSAEEGEMATTAHTKPAGMEDDTAASTRDRLLEAAIYIAGTAGLDKVTYRSVGDRIGASHSLVRFYFGTRDELIARAFERAVLRDAAEGNLSSDDIDTFASNLIATLIEHPARELLQFDFLLHAVRGNGRISEVRALNDHYYEQIAGTLTRVGITDPDGSIGRLILAAIDGLVLQHAAYQSVDRTAAILEQLRSMLNLLRSAQLQS